MKTIMIYDECGTEPIKFAVLEGDYRHLDRIYINSDYEDKRRLKRQSELESLLFDEAGKHQLNLVDEFPLQEVKDGAFVIVAGFLP